MRRNTCGVRCRVLNYRITLLSFGLFLAPLVSTTARAQEFAWAAQVGGQPSLSDTASGVAVDDRGAVYTVGRFGGTADFDPGPGVFELTSVGSIDSYIWKLDAERNLAWAHRLGIDSVIDVEIESVTTDGLGNVYVCGSFGSTVDFDPGPGVVELTSAGVDDGFVASYDGAGGLRWARNVVAGSQKGDAMAVAVDGSGNVHLTGVFLGTADFDPGPGIVTMGSIPLQWDTFVTKLDGGGNLVWVGLLAGTSFVNGTDVKVSDDGDVWVGGSFFGTADFDPGPGTLELTTFGGGDGYVVRLDPDGELEWVAQFGGTNLDITTEVALDAVGNVYAAGTFYDTADFDPGPGVFEMSPGGDHDAFVTKLSDTGAFVWARQIGDRADGRAGASSLRTDYAGRVTAAGTFYGTVDLDPGPGALEVTSQGIGDAYVVQVDPAGAIGWGLSFGGSEGELANALALGPVGEVHVSGKFSGTVDFDPGPGTFELNSVGPSDGFVVRLGLADPTPATGPTGALLMLVLMSALLITALLRRRARAGAPSDTAPEN